MLNRFAYIVWVGWALLYTLPASAQNSFSNTRTEARSLTHEMGLQQIDALHQRAVVLAEANPDSAITMFQTCYQYSKLLFYPEGAVRGLFYMGNSYAVGKGELPQALACFRKAYSYCLQTTGKKREELLAAWNNNMGGAFLMQGNYDSAMTYLFSALALSVPGEGKNKERLANIYTNISRTYYTTGDYDKALPYLEKARDIQIEKKLNADLVNTYYQFAALFDIRQQFDTALQYLEKIKALQVYMNDNAKGRMYLLAGAIYTHQGLPQKAIASYKIAMVLQGSNMQDKVNNLTGIGAACFVSKDYRKAVHYFHEALKISDKIGLSGQQPANIYMCLSETYDSLRDYKHAYQYKVRENILNDSLNRIKNSKKFDELENRYQSSQKDKELTAKKLQLVTAEARLRAKNIWIISGMAGVLVLFISMIVLVQKQRLQLQKSKTGKQKQKVEQLKAAIDGEEKERSRIGRQLHDDIMVQLSIVKMGLHALPMKYSVIKDAEDYKNIVQQLDYASQKVRQTAHNLMPDGLLEDGLVSAISYFCSNVALMSQLRIQFQHYGDIPRFASDTEVSVYRMVQELVQNVIKHAAAVNVLVELSYREKMLSITVEDDGNGFKPEQDMIESKMGLKSIRTRLKALNGTMDIYRCAPQGTSVNIELIP